MPTIIHRLPYFRDASSARVPNGAAVAIRSHQIALWVSISEPDVLELPPSAPRFPAILDTAFNDNFLLQEQQLVDWARLDPKALQQTDAMRIYGEAIPVFAANVWIHMNLTGFRDQFSPRLPFCLELSRGIGVGRPPLNMPRLPVLGLRGLERNRLQILIDAARLQVSIRSSR